MQEHCPGFYELEFQRLYRMQGRILYKLRYWYRQLNCYQNLYSELQNEGINSDTLRNRMIKTIDNITEYDQRRAILEADKEAVSVNNPANAEHAKAERIIQAAYEHAYANQQ